MSHDARGGKPPIIVAAGIVIEAGRVLVSRRKKGTHLEAHWEFPGGKVEPGETPQRALQRELMEELGIECEVLAPMEVTFFSYPSKDVLLLFFEAARTAGSAEPRALDADEVRWVGVDELDGLQFPPADLPVLERVRAELRRRRALA